MKKLLIAIAFVALAAPALAGDYDTPRPYDNPVPTPSVPPVACQINPNGC